MFSILLFTFFISIAYLVFLQKSNRKLRLPAGPRGVLLLGNLLQVIKDPHLKFSKWAYEFGKLYTIRLGTADVVVITDSKYAREILSNNSTTGKFQNDTFQLLTQGPYGIIKTSGKQWVEQRRFLLQRLKSFGFSGKALEPLVNYDAQCLVEWMQRERLKDNGAVVLKDVLRLVAINSLWMVMAGERLPLEHSELSKLLDEFMSSFQGTMKTGLGFFPWLKYIAPHKSGYVALDQASKKLHAFIKQYLEKYNTESSEQGTSENCLIKEYVDQVKSEKDPASSFYGSTGEKNSIAALVELFIAGSETTSNTIEWLIFYLCLNLHVQRKMQKEISQVLGETREPTMEDREKMPYTEACILETLRYNSLIHMGTINQLLDDMEYKGFYMTKGTLLLTTVYHIHHDKNIWGDPENFRPERFLGSDKEELKSHLIPFLVGKRLCLADNFSKDILFLFVTKIFQNFYIEKHLDVSKEDYLKPDVGQALCTNYHKVVLHCR